MFRTPRTGNKRAATALEECLRHPDGFAAALLEQVRVAALAVAADGTVQLANSAASTMLDKGDVLFTCGEQRLQLRCARSQRSLAIALAQDGTGGNRQGSSFLAEAPESPTAYLVRVASLATNGEPSPRLVTVVSMNDAPQLDTDLLQSLYGLSRAEAKVAACLGLGQDVTTCAKQLGVQPATVRAQLKAVFRKMSINRQQDLVRIATLLGHYSGH